MKKIVVFQLHLKLIVDYALINFYCFYFFLYSLNQPLAYKYQLSTGFDKYSNTQQFQIKNFYIKYKMMKTIQDLQKAVAKVFGEKLKRIDTPAAYWQQFTPYEIIGSQASSTLLLKLIEIPSNFRTSEEIIEKVKIKFRNLIHQVEFIFVQRNFENTSYLLLAKQNLVSVESYLQIKKQSKELIEQNVIQKYIQFASQLQAHPLSSQLSFSINQIGITKQGKFLLINYKIYFIQEANQQPKNIKKDIRYMIFKLLSPNEQNIDISQLYSFVQQNYNKKISSIFQKCLSDPELKTSQILSTQIIEPDGNLMETTLTDSFHSSVLAVSDIQNITAEASDLSEGLLTNKSGSKSKNRFKNIAIFAVVFVVILLIIGAVTFKYLNPRPLTCSDTQYLDKQKNACFGCDTSCDTCSQGTNISCLSCKDGLFLVKKDRNQRAGKCSLSCSGTKLKSNVCIDNF